MTIRDLPVPIGDAAQVRKALEVIRSKAIFMKGMYNVPSSLVANLMEIIAIANTALAAPARNCDVGSLEEQKERFERFCAEHPYKDGGYSRCNNCHLGKSEHCELDWVQKPYEGDKQKGTYS